MRIGPPDLPMRDIKLCALAVRLYARRVAMLTGNMPWSAAGKVQPPQWLYDRALDQCRDYLANGRTMREARELMRKLETAEQHVKWWHNKRQMRPALATRHGLTVKQRAKRGRARVPWRGAAPDMIATFLEPNELLDKLAGERGPVMERYGEGYRRVGLPFGNWSDVFGKRGGPA